MSVLPQDAVCRCPGGFPYIQKRGECLKLSLLRLVTSAKQQRRVLGGGYAAMRYLGTYFPALCCVDGKFTDVGFRAFWKPYSQERE